MCLSEEEEEEDDDHRGRRVHHGADGGRGHREDVGEKEDFQ